jgi:hypothetical protein
MVAWQAPSQALTGAPDDGVPTKTPEVTEASEATKAVEVTAPVKGNATWFYALGAPYGGCGLPQGELDSPHFVALNVYDLPGDYSTFYDRPMDPSLSDKMGLWDNGHNCGRWVRVKIGDRCTGVNDGQPNKPFCHQGSWVSDKYNGATLDMLVADSCGDGNAWCRDDPYHLDLAQASLNQFVKDGEPVGDMEPDHWGNRQIEWEFIEAPEYTGDIRVGFLQSAMPWWPAIAVSHLPDGLHGVEYYQEGTWKSAEMNGDMGQSYIIGATVPGETRFQIRIRDVNDELLNDGRVYNFTFPDSCEGSCNGAYTQATYTTSTGPQPDPTSTQDPRTATCSAKFTKNNSWDSGYMGDIVVKADDEPLNGWTVSWDKPDGQEVASVWNGSLISEGPTVTVRNASWNRSVAAKGTVTVGVVVEGDAPIPDLTCTSP